MNVFSKAITDSNGKRSTIFKRCLTGDAPLWVVYWLFGIVGGVLIGAVSLIAVELSPISGIVLMSLYAIWWSISIWQCASYDFQSSPILTRSVLLLGLSVTAAQLSGLINIDEGMIAILLNILSILWLVQFILVYLVTFVFMLIGFGTPFSGFVEFMNFVAEGRNRVSPQMARGMHRARFADIGMRERPKDRQRREDEGARFLEKWKAYPGDSRGIGG